MVSLPSADPNPIPPAFASDPLVNLSEIDEEYSTKINLSPGGKASSSLPEGEIVEIDDPSIMKSTSPDGVSDSQLNNQFKLCYCIAFYYFVYLDVYVEVSRLPDLLHIAAWCYNKEGCFPC